MSGAFSFYGGSDDLIEVGYPDGSQDEIGSYDKPWFGLLTAPDGRRVEVVGRYEHNGCWSFGLRQVLEDDRVPPWPVRFENVLDCEYSVRLVIDCPEGTLLSWAGADEEDD